MVLLFSWRWGHAILGEGNFRNIPLPLPTLGGAQTGVLDMGIPMPRGKFEKYLSRMYMCLLLKWEVPVYIYIYIYIYIYTYIYIRSCVSLKPVSPHRGLGWGVSDGAPC